MRWHVLVTSYSKEEVALVIDQWYLLHKPYPLLIWVRLCGLENFRGNNSANQSCPKEKQMANNWDGMAKTSLQCPQSWFPSSYLSISLPLSLACSFSFWSQGLATLMSPSQCPSLSCNFHCHAQQPPSKSTKAMVGISSRYCQPSQKHTPAIEGCIHCHIITWQ